MESANQLIKYKKIKAELDKKFPKKSTWQSFTIDVSYGGNKEHNLKRISLGGAASDKKISYEFVDLLKQCVNDNIDFWQKVVLQDIRKLEESLK